MTELTDDKVRALLDGATENAYDLEVVKWGGGIRCVYLNDYRVAGEKPWGGGDTTRHFKVRMADIMQAFRGTVQAAAPDLARALLDARAELARVKADAAAAQALVIINLESDLLDRVLEGSVWSMPEGTHTTDEWGRGVTDARRDIAAAVRATFADIADNDGLAMVSEPHDPGDGWTWNERLGWIGPDGKPAARGGA
jgi:hypothetical protein